MSDAAADTTSLRFRLQVEDDWPPVGLESLPFRKAGIGFKALVPPLFVKDLSVGDLIEVRLDDDGTVDSWRHVIRSDHTTIWLLRLKRTEAIDDALAKLRALGCSTADLEASGCYAIDVPSTQPITIVDSILSKLDENAVAIAYPSMRHPE